MPRSLSILSFAAALALAGAAMAQDATAEQDNATETDAAAAEASTEATTDSSATNGTEAGEAADAETSDDAASTAEPATDEAAAGDALPLGEAAAAAEPAVYIKEESGDWSIRCFHNEQGEDPCQLYQLLHEEGGNPVAELSIFRLEGQEPAVAGATAIVPLYTLLTEEMQLSVDGGAAKSYPYRLCSPAGCITQMGLTAEDISSFKKGKAIAMVIVPAQAPDQRVKIDVSLTGFTAGYDKLSAISQ